MLNFLKKIVNNKILEIKHRKNKISFRMIVKIFDRLKKKEFSPTKNIIGEIKLFTPILGKICKIKNINNITEKYKSFNLKTFSVLTEKVFFAGNYSYIPIIKSKSNNNKINILRKDFIFDIYQVYESIIIGSDILLLILCVIKIRIIKKILLINNIFFILETYSELDIKKANIVNEKRKTLVGVNFRNLVNTKFKNKIDILKSLKKIKNNDIIIESSIKKTKEIYFYKKLGFNLLIGHFFIDKIINESIFRN
ncbi:hypothetical protein ACWNYO_00185 [Candidatus Vidania fulgoroideorum]